MKKKCFKNIHPSAAKCNKNLDLASDNFQIRPFKTIIETQIKKKEFKFAMS